MSLCSIKQKETIMKKTYINPEIEVVTVKSQQLLAGSLGRGEGSLNASQADARDFDFDDEE